MKQIFSVEVNLSRKVVRTTEWELESCPRDFCVLFHFLGWSSIQLGFHIDLAEYNMEIHLPFCFIRIGMEAKSLSSQSITKIYTFKGKPIPHET